MGSLVNVYVPFFVKKCGKTWNILYFFLNLQPIIQNDWALSDDEDAAKCRTDRQETQVTHPHYNHPRGTLSEEDRLCLYL